MVIYLGINYLEQAVTAKQNLLGKCLIVVPQHLDHVEAYLHKGKLPDEKYRFPWKRAKRGDELLVQESTNIIADAMCLVTEDARTFDIAPYTSQQRKDNTSLTETVNFDLDCDVIPSSNPCSPDLFSPDDFFTEQNLFQETFEKENLNVFSSACDLYLNTEFLKIESTENTDETPGDSQADVPDLSRLAADLKAVPVKDPFLQETSNPVSEKLIFRRNEDKCSEKAVIPMLEDTYDVDIVAENFHRVSPPPSPKAELEDIVEIDPDCLGPDSIHLMKSELLTSVREYNTVIVMENEPDVSTVVSNDVVKLEQIHLQVIEKNKSSSAATVNTTFLDINEIIVTEQDRLYEKAILDSPVVDGSSSALNYTQKPLPLPGRDKFETTISDPNSRLLDAERMQSLMQRIWQSQKYCDEIQASRLPEPEIPKEVEKKKQTIIQTKRMLEVMPDTTTGNSDLELNWEIIKYMEDITDPCKIVINMDNRNCQEQIKDIEQIEKYQAADLYDWQDEEIRFEVCGDKDTVNKEHGRFPKPKAKTNVAVQEQELKKKLMFSDPLSDFIALRSKNSTLMLKNAKAENTVNEQIKPGEAISADGDQTREEIAKLKQNFESKKRVKHHVVKIRISEEYQDIVDMLETASENCLNVLKQASEISQSFTFKSATPDISRFLLKQKEKYLADHGLDVSSDDLYKMIVLLHGLVVSSEITVNCCLESAIGYLGALQEKYKDILGASLDSVRTNLFEIKAQFYEKKVYHPKVMTLCKEVETWLKKKRAKTKDTEQKILILVRREVPSLLNCLKNALSLGNMLSPCILSSSESEHIIGSLDKHNCVIALTKMVSKNFPWAQFSLVVEYENESSSPWQQLCERQHIRHIGLCVQSDKEQETSYRTSEYPEKQISLISSQKVIQNTELLQLLETRYNILLIERDYSIIGDTEHLYFSDIDIDGSSAIVIEDIKNINNDGVVQMLVTKMVALSLKYDNCWFILFPCSKNGSYQYPGHVVSNIGRLQAAFANFVDKSSYFKAKVVFCGDCNEASSVIRTISENCMEKSKAVRSWLDRAWLTDEITKEERFLLMLPCLSSFSSQLLLQKVPIKKVFISSKKDLYKETPEIALSVLQTLETLVSSSSRLRLRGELSTDEDFDENKTEYATSESTDQNIKTSKGEVDKLTCQYIQAERKDNLSRDVYIPEDFQKFSEDIGCDTNVLAQTSVASMTTSVEAEKKSDWKDLKMKNKNVENYVCENSQKQLVHDESNVKRDTEEYITERTKYFGRQGNLDKFISRESMPQRGKTCSYDLTEDKNITCESKNMKNPRYLNPVEKLQILRKGDVSTCSGPERINIREHFGAFESNKRSDECQYFNAQNTNDNVNNGKVSVSQFPNLINDTEQMVTEHQKKKHPYSNGEKYIYEVDHDKLPLQKTKQNAFSVENINNHNHEHVHKMSATVKETFDYNHGLPFHSDHSVIRNESEKSSKSDVFENTFCKNNQVSKNGTHSNFGYARGCRMTKSRNDLERGFQLSEEIDRSISTEKDLINSSSNMISKRSGSNLRVRRVSQNSTTHENCPFEGSINVSDNLEYLNHRGANSFLASTERGYRQNDYSELLKRNSPVLTSIEFQALKKFDFQPKMIVAFNNSDKMKADVTDRNYEPALLVNPKLERITQRRHGQEETAEMNENMHAMSLADELRETTRKLLANSRQFSGFDVHLKRHPLQKVSIGLAQPRLRNSTKVTEDLQIPEDDRMLMSQSEWATYDSPPMDLAYDNSEINSILQNKQDTSNRAIYTNQTPRKKRKLTYQSVPGKGQTKLIFM